MRTITDPFVCLLCVSVSCDIFAFIGDSVVFDALVRFIHLLLPGLLPLLLADNGYVRTVRFIEGFKMLLKKQLTR